ncbi:uncharacterized protein LOC120110672 [Phoenix dactylifera]|uniref:Uncharacterized protein LOC120110672 n=1 Tax=Phoenix dactylifera TaxID=42345 RepID=A0A8B9AE07_PHODC|nr:uncharacterized protein LOC120110672 [Phoenix dactylifera]
MARLMLFLLVVADIFATVAMARPSPVVVRADAVELIGSSAAKPPSSSLSPNDSEVVLAGAPENLQNRKCRSAFDKSIAGGEIILAGLATAIFAAVFCYIRVTRQRVEVSKY